MIGMIERDKDIEIKVEKQIGRKGIVRKRDREREEKVKERGKKVCV
jgi:hypothetical protein